MIMSDTSTHDAAIEAINEQLTQLDHDIQATTRRLDINTAVRDRLIDLRATLSRKPRGRRPRVVEALDAVPGTVLEPAVEEAPEAETSPAAWPGFSVVQPS